MFLDTEFWHGQFLVEAIQATYYSVTFIYLLQKMSPYG